MEKALDEMNALGAWELEDKAITVLEQVGIPDPNMSVDKMSGGQRRKVTVAAALLGQPDVLILDEPTNHMDVQVRDLTE
jgi:ATP-binding cassette subfamily F protein uup